MATKKKGDGAAEKTAENAEKAAETVKKEPKTAKNAPKAQENAEEEAETAETVNARVIARFIDRVTGETRKRGEVIEVSRSRFEEIAAKGRFVEEIGAE